MTLFLRFIDGFSDILGALGRLALGALILAMIYEVAARYVFGAPTLWAFDISYMLNGAIFLLGSAYALRRDVHVRIDFLSQRLPLRAQQILNGVVYLGVMAPLIGLFAWTAAGKAFAAYLSGEVEAVSPWAPLMWPFYAVIALGLTAFALQFIAEALKYFAGRIAPGQAESEAMAPPLTSETRP